MPEATMVEATLPEMAAVPIAQVMRYAQACNQRWADMIGTLKLYQGVEAFALAAGVNEEALALLVAGHRAKLIEIYNGTANGGNGPPNLDDFA